jgi:hypothetical protein
MGSCLISTTVTFEVSHIHLSLRSPKCFHCYHHISSYPMAEVISNVATPSVYDHANRKCICTPFQRPMHSVRPVRQDANVAQIYGMFASARTSRGQRGHPHVSRTGPPDSGTDASSSTRHNLRAARCSFFRSALMARLAFHARALVGGLAVVGH